MKTPFNFLILPPYIAYLCLLLLSAYIHAQTPTDEELKALEQQIEQQEAEQTEANRKAAEAMKRKAEEQEAGRKAAEAQIRAEEEARQHAEQEARAAAEAEAQRKEEESRLLREQQQREQFSQYMQNGDLAMNKKGYPEALLAYTQALEIFPNDSAALSGQSRAQEYLSVCAALIGEWDWFFGTSAIVSADGKLQAIALIPNQGSWECTDPSQRKFTLNWEVGGWVDTATLSIDGNTVDVINNIGIRFQGWRKGTRSEQPAPKNPLLGN